MITVEDFHKLEKLSGQHGVSSSMLMERAGKSFYEYLKKHLDLSAKTAVVFAGYGDNAGEGFVLARLLSKDCFVFVFLYGETKKFSGDTSAAFTRIQGNDHVDVLRPDQIDAHTRTFLLQVGNPERSRLARDGRRDKLRLCTSRRCHLPDPFLEFPVGA